MSHNFSVTKHKLDIFKSKSALTFTIKVAELRETLKSFYLTRKEQNQVVICDFAILLNRTPLCI